MGHYDRVFLSGKFDRIDIFEDGNIEVVDYKTSANVNGLPDRQEMAGSLSNLIYYRLACSLYNNIKTITVSQYFLRSRRKISVEYSPEIVAEARGDLQNLLDHLERGIAPSVTGHSCSWCLVRKTGKCPHFEHAETNISLPDF